MAYDKKGCGTHGYKIGLLLSPTRKQQNQDFLACNKFTCERMIFFVAIQQRVQLKY